MYHWEDDQEDFLVLSGEALLLVEGEERILEQWDLVHCPAKTNHVILGAGAGPCLVLAVGARVRLDRTELGWLPGRRGRAPPRTRGVERSNTPIRAIAYAAVPAAPPGAPYREGWLPE